MKRRSRTMAVACAVMEKVQTGEYTACWFEAEDRERVEVASSLIGSPGGASSRAALGPTPPMTCGMGVVDHRETAGLRRRRGGRRGACRAVPPAAITVGWSLRSPANEGAQGRGVPLDSTALIQLKRRRRRCRRCSNVGRPRKRVRSRPLTGVRGGVRPGWAHPGHRHAADGTVRLRNVANVFDVGYPQGYLESRPVVERAGAGSVRATRQRTLQCCGRTRSLS